MKKIIVVIPFFGTLPAYFSIWLDSLKSMPFEVLFLTDGVGQIHNAPKNFHIKETSFEDLVALFEEKLGTECRIEKPYKFCDLKPMYGYVFYDQIREYDYWGFGDIDLFYGGSLASLINDLTEKNYDVISFRKYWVSGSLCFLKNKETLRNMFLKSQDWEFVVKNPEACMFDECGATHGLLSDGTKTIYDVCNGFESFTYLLQKEKEEKSLNCFFEDIVTESISCKDIVHYQNGLLKLNKENIFYFHFVLIKKRSFFFFPETFAVFKNNVYIDNTGFYSAKSLFFRNIIRIYRKVKGGFRALRNRGFNNLFMRLNGLWD